MILPVVVNLPPRILSRAAKDDTQNIDDHNACLTTVEGGGAEVHRSRSSWIGRVWCCALSSLFSLYLGLVQVLVLMIPFKRDVKETQHASAAVAAVPAEGFLLVDIFAACLTIMPAADNWCRTWAADRTVMLRMTSKRFKELVDKLRPPVVVRWRMSFLQDERKGTAAEKLKLVFRQLAALSARSRITTLDLRYTPILAGSVYAYTDLRMTGQDARRLAGVLAQCPALAHLDLRYNGYNYTGGMGAVGSGKLRASWLGRAPGLLL